MIADAALRWTVTAVFVACSGYCTYRLVTRGHRVAQFNLFAHLLMSIAMIAMAWPSGMGLPAEPQIVVFGLAAVWLIVQALLAGQSWMDGAHGSHDSRGGLWYHAFMMAAMVFMVAIMGRAGVWIAPTALAVAAVFALSAVRWLVAAARRPHRGHCVVERSYEVLMAAGMASMFFVLA